MDDAARWKKEDAATDAATDAAREAARDAAKGLIGPTGHGQPPCVGGRFIRA